MSGVHKRLSAKEAHVTGRPQHRNVDRIQLLNQIARDIHIDRNLFTDAQNECARVFQAPLYVRHDEVHGRSPVLSIDMDIHGHSDPMGSTVQIEIAVHFCARIVDRRDAAHKALRAERDERILLNFQYLCFHLAVACATPAVSTGCIYDEFALERSCLFIEMDRAFFYAERPADGVKHVAKHEMNLALFRIDPECLRLRRERLGSDGREYKNGGDSYQGRHMS